MDSPSVRSHFPFLMLPTEIRLSIYSYSLNWPSKLFDQSSNSPTSKKATSSSLRYTPPILLLNRQVSAEALHILYEKPFRLTSPPLSRDPMTNFLSETTIQRLRFMILDIDLADGGTYAYGWDQMLNALLGIVADENSLEVVKVRGSYEATSKALGWTYQQAANHNHAVSAFKRLRELSHYAPVTFEKEIERWIYA